MTVPASVVPKRFRNGTHRLVSPEETVERLRPLLPVLGVTRIANATGLDTLGVPVAMAFRPNSRSLSVAQGKGLTLAAAKASAMMEAIESFHAERIDLPLKLASWNELRFTHRLADIAALPRLSVSAFHENLRTFWVEGTDLLSGQSRWVPYEMVHTHYTLPLLPGSGSFLMSSNGLASGNHLLEAISHGICEVVERDATTLWHCLGRHARHRTRVEPSTIDDAACREVLEKFERAGVDAGIWEATSDTGIAAFVCTIVDREPNPNRPIAPMTGIGCHPSRGIALLRALTEAAQSRITLISGARDDISHAPTGTEGDFRQALRFHEELHAVRPVRGFHEAPDHPGETFDDDVAWELGRLREVGIREVIAVDLTRREFRVPVVRIIIPGLEPLNEVPGYVPGPRARRLLMERGG